MNGKLFIGLACLYTLALGCQSSSRQQAEQEWKALNDTIAHYSRQIAVRVRLIQACDQTTEANQQSLMHDIDSIDRLMKKAIRETAERNKDNELGQYIHENYTEE